MSAADSRGALRALTAAQALLNEAQARKTDLEAALLTEQLTPRHKFWEAVKAMAGASGLVLALISIVGGGASIYRWFQDQETNRQLRIEERLERSLDGLSAERAAQRVAAAGSLKSFLSENQERNARVSVAVGYALAMEADQVARGAMLSFFKSLDQASVDLAPKNAALVTLVELNREIVRDKSLWLEPPGNWYRFSTEDPKGQRLEATVIAISTLLRQGARVRDLSGTYLVLADLSQLDLSNTKFDDAMLNWTNFAGSTLRGASFNGANLDWTSFAAADLREAKLTYVEASARGARRFSFVVQNLAEGRGLTLPDFDCADLRGADFTGFPLFNATEDEMRTHPGASGWLRFEGANLGNANLQRVGIYFMEPPRGRRGPPLFDIDDGNGQGRVGGPMAIIGTLSPQSPPPARIGRFQTAVDELRGAFFASNLAGARLPQQLAPYLSSAKRAPATVRGCTPRAPW
jgi:uncharacterized protein YjbI with pentapeptide repeats